MRQRGVALVPTLAASEAISRYVGWKPGGEPEPPRVREAHEMFARALKSGVTIANGSDVGVFAHGENAREIELMVAYGMTPVQALRAATATAAAVLRRDKELGRVAAEYVADLVVVRGDPLVDVSVLRKVELVIKEGWVAVDRR
jgi:imidazolonepropionase-like amidohydrolase